jgi:predicted transcriptional regulator
MTSDSSMDLSRRERQIMDVIYQRGRASVAEVRSDLPDPPSYSAVRTLLGILEGKGHLTHTKEGSRYVYLPTRPRTRAGRAALKRVLRTFYEGSVESAVAALLDISEDSLSEEEIRRLSQLIDKARREGR